ncbi:MAG: GAF domain-containing protein [Lachnospiraceae bacterium]
MKERYELLLQQMDALLEGETDTIANLSNVSALVFHALEHVNWAGFYLHKNGELILGPFQGKPACMHISLERGVCGKAARLRETQCIANVHEFEGHIACDGASNSEIVVPIIIDGVLFGVLDIDSYEFGNFGEVDVVYLEKLVEGLKAYIVN